MSTWDAYITDQLMVPLEGGGQLENAAIVSKEDGGVWAQSETFPEISDGEFAALTKGLADPSSLQGAFLLGKEKYMLVRSEPELVLCGKKGKGG
jgi:profilin